MKNLIFERLGDGCRRVWWRTVDSLWAVWDGVIRLFGKPPKKPVTLEGYTRRAIIPTMYVDVYMANPELKKLFPDRLQKSAKD